MWPTRFDLNLGDIYPLQTSAGMRLVKLLDVQEFYWADYFTSNPARQTLSHARITVDISGQIATLSGHRARMLAYLRTNGHLHLSAEREKCQW
jgi:hypothetical protein